MSHFTVMVVTDDENDVEAALQPYHEYECTGTMDEYVEFVEAEESMEQLEAQYQKSKEEYGYKSFANFMEKYHGYKLHDGEWGHFTNPNSKWDCWTIGGRWTNSLKLKESEIEEYCDAAQKQHVDMDGMNQSLIDTAKTEYDNFHSKLTKTEIVFVLDTWQARRDGANRDFQQKEVNAILNKFGDPFQFVFGNEFEQLATMTREEYIECAGTWSPYALLYDGKWYSKGDMGWWGISSNEESQWTGSFVELWNSIPDDNWITMVDCHI